MSDESKKLGNRYVNDLRKLEFAQQQTANAQFGKLPFFIAGLFLIVAGYWG